MKVDGTDPPLVVGGGTQQDQREHRPHPAWVVGAGLAGEHCWVDCMPLPPWEEGASAAGPWPWGGQEGEPQWLVRGAWKEQSYQKRAVPVEGAKPGFAGTG